MNRKLDRIFNRIRKSDGHKQRESFILYCLELIQLEEQSKLSEEEVAYKIVDTMRFNQLTDYPECNIIFDIAGRTEVPRYFSIDRTSEKWDKKTVDAIKQREWNELTVAIKKARDLVLKKAII